MPAARFYGLFSVTLAKNISEMKNLKVNPPMPLEKALSLFLRRWQYVILCRRDYTMPTFTLNWRARRSEFWGVTLFFVILVGILVLPFLFFALLGKIEFTELARDFIFIFLPLALWLVLFPVGIPRLRDIGIPDFWWFCGFITFLFPWLYNLPILGLLVLCLQDSAPETNEWGPSPKYDVAE